MNRLSWLRETPRLVPQEGQKATSPGSAEPQFGHESPSPVPQWAQNLAPSTFACPHDEQFATGRLYGTFATSADTKRQWRSSPFEMPIRGVEMNIAGGWPGSSRISDAESSKSSPL